MRPQTMRTLDTLDGACTDADCSRSSTPTTLWHSDTVRDYGTAAHEIAFHFEANNGALEVPFDADAEIGKALLLEFRRVKF